MSGYAPVQKDTEPDFPNLIDPDEPSVTPAPVAHQPAQAKQPDAKINQMGFYARYFDINTEEFLGKVILALNPFNPASTVPSHEHDAVTELYGFIWINATIVFFMFFSATGANLLANWLHSEANEKYEYSFKLLTLSISVFYGYSVAVPALVYAATSWYMNLTNRLSLTKLISVYSYGNIRWVPTTCINIVLAVFISNAKHHTVLNALQWALVLATAGFGGMFKVLRMIDEHSASLLAEDEVRKRKLHVAVMLAAVEAAFAVIVKVSFFGIV